MTTSRCRSQMCLASLRALTSVHPSLRGSSSQPLSTATGRWVCPVAAAPIARLLTACVVHSCSPGAMAYMDSWGLEASRTSFRPRKSTVRLSAAHPCPALHAATHTWWAAGLATVLLNGGVRSLCRCAAFTACAHVKRQCVELRQRLVWPPGHKPCQPSCGGVCGCRRNCQLRCGRVLLFQPHAHLPSPK